MRHFGVCDANALQNRGQNAQPGLIDARNHLLRQGRIGRPGAHGGFTAQDKVGATWIGKGFGQRLKALGEEADIGFEGLTKKERLGLEREQSKLQASLGGIREMGGVPDLIFVIDVKKEALAVAEANKLGIPVVAVVDTNCKPDGIDYIIPGNDDAARAITLYCDLVSRAALDGMSAQLGAAGVDMGAVEEAPVAETLAEEPAASEEPAAETPAETPTETPAES